MYFLARNFSCALHPDERCIVRFCQSDLSSQRASWLVCSSGTYGEDIIWGDYTGPQKKIFFSLKTYLKTPVNFVFKCVYRNGQNSLHIFSTHWFSLLSVTAAVHLMVSYTLSNWEILKESVRPGNLIISCLELLRVKPFSQVLATYC